MRATWGDRLHPQGRGYYRCKRCRQDRVAQRRRTLKQILVANAGEKRLAISANRVTLSLAALRAEAQKCVLVCSNCHAELEGGVANLPDRVTLADGPGNTP